MGRPVIQAVVILAGDLGPAMCIAKGSLFLGRMTPLMAGSAS